jgi:mannose-6-phosphate isomerase-like protein (cupin superfamily)
MTNQSTTTSTTSPRSVYCCAERIAAQPPDYPGTRVGLLVDEHVAGTECFGGVVAIDEFIPLHYHPVFEFQYVLQGTGLALDSLGREIPIAPGGAVLSPAGPSGAHGFRNTGAVPLEILFLYPSREGKPPGRTAFEGVGREPEGPLSVYRPPEKLAPQVADYPGTQVGLLVDQEIAGTECFGGIVSIDESIPLHYHPVFEFQYVLSGTGVAIDSRGVEVAIAPGGAVLSPAGASGAHGFRNTGATPLRILFLYPSPDGRPPGRTAFELARSDA